MKHERLLIARRYRFILGTVYSESGQATFTFRATKFTESGYELINEYVVTVYNTDAPILTDLWTDNATMKTKSHR